MNYKRFVPLAVSAMVLFALGLGLYARAVPAAVLTLAVADSAGNAAAQPNIAWSPYGEQAIAVAGQPLSASYGSENALPTASIAKVMTALAVLHAKPLTLGQQGPTMTMTSNDVQVYEQELSVNESVVQVSAGEQLSEYQALEAMLVPSATNVADTTAVWAFGSMSNYLAFANQYAAQLGLKNSHFASDASGFSPDTVSTPEDLVKLGEVALQNPVIAQIVNQQSVTLPVVGTVQNFDIDLGQNGIIGIKTGNTNQAGGAFLFAAKYQGLTIVGAIMGAPDLGTALHDAPEVLGSLESNLQITQPVKAGQTVVRYKLPWGGTVDGIAQKSLTAVTWQGARPAISNSAVKLKSGEAAGTQIGTITVGSQGTAQQANVVLEQPMRGPSIWWRIFHL